MQRTQECAFNKYTPGDGSVQGTDDHFLSCFIKLLRHTDMHNSALKIQLPFLPLSFESQCQIAWKTLSSTLSKKILLREYFFHLLFLSTKISNIIHLPGWKNISSMKGKTGENRGRGNGWTHAQGGEGSVLHAPAAAAVCSVLSDPLQPQRLRLPGSSIHGISQARLLERVAISYSRGSSQPSDRTCVSCIGRQIFTTAPLG